MSALASVFLLMPTVGSSYPILTALTAQLYLVMYILLFLSAIRLRYTQPNVPRSYRISGGNWGMWVVAGIGIIGSLSAFALGWVMPAQLKTGGTGTYVAFLIGGVIVICAPPVLIYHFRRPEWVQAAPDEDNEE